MLHWILASCLVRGSVLKQSAAIYDDDSRLEPILTNPDDVKQFTPEFGNLQSCNLNRLPNSVEMRGIIETKDPEMVADLNGCSNPMPPFNNGTSNFSLQFFRNKISPEGIANGTYNMKSKEDVTRRGLAFPEYTQCDDKKILCVPGPCAVWDVDYLLDSHHIDPQIRQVLINNARKNASIPFKMIGKPHCGPSFGVQMYNRDTKDTEPTDDTLHGSATISIFPTRNGNFVILYSPLDGNLELPLPDASGKNSNPLWYYLHGSETYRRYGTDDVLEKLTCGEKTRAPYVLPDSSVNIQNGEDELINLGWGNSSFQWAPSSKLDTLGEDKTWHVAMNYQQGIFDNLKNTTFLEIVETSNFTFPSSSNAINGTGYYNSTTGWYGFPNFTDSQAYEWLSEHNPSSKVPGFEVNSYDSTDPRRTMFMVPQFVPHYNNSNSSNAVDPDEFRAFFLMDEMCDLTQCSWTPITDAKGLGADWREQSLNCMYAEMIQFYISKINISWITDAFAEIQEGNTFPLPLYCLKPRKPYCSQCASTNSDYTLRECLDNLYSNCKGIRRKNDAASPYERPSGVSPFTATVDKIAQLLCNFNIKSVVNPDLSTCDSVNGDLLGYTFCTRNLYDGNGIPYLQYNFSNVVDQLSHCKDYVENNCPQCTECPKATGRKNKNRAFNEVPLCFGDGYFNPEGGTSFRGDTTCPPVDPNWGQPAPWVPSKHDEPFKTLKSFTCHRWAYNQASQQIPDTDHPFAMEDSIHWASDLYNSITKMPPDNEGFPIRSTIHSLVRKSIPTRFGCRPKRIFSGNPDRAKHNAAVKINDALVGGGKKAESLNDGDPNINPNDAMAGKWASAFFSKFGGIGPMAWVPELIHSLRSTKGITGVNVAAQTYDPQRRALCHPNAAHTLSLSGNDQWKDPKTGLTCEETMATHNQNLDPTYKDPNLGPEKAEKCGFIADAIHQYRYSDKSTRDSHIGRLWLATLMCFTNTYSNKTTSRVEMMKALMEVDMEIDSWAMPASPEYFDPKLSEGNYYPQDWAKTPLNQWVSSPINVNASFLNSQGVVDSHSCDCGSALPMYKLVGGPWDEAKYLFGWGNTAQFQYQNTWITEAGMGWDRNVDSISAENPIGLYLPSNNRWSPNFTTYERDVLLPDTYSSVTNLTLLNETYMGYNVPKKDKLSSLLFDPVKGPWGSTENQPQYTVRKIVYKYGSCMRYPYGQLPMVSMTDQDKTKYFTKPSHDNTEFFVAEEALMGYCETFHANLSDPHDSGKYAFCLNDGLSIDARDAFCNSPGASRVVVGATLNPAATTVDHVCDKLHKTCIVIPEAPVMFPSVTKLLESDFDFSGFTILITPFNWTTAKGFMAPNRRYYDIGREKNIADNMMPLVDKDFHTMGMQSLSKDEFMMFANNSLSVSDIQTFMASIDVKLKENNNRTCTGNQNAPVAPPDKCYNLPWVSGNNLTESDIYPPITEYNIPIKYENITIRSALTTRRLSFACAKSKHGANAPCTQFLVSASGFTLETTDIDQTGCENVPDLYKTAVTYGGPTVSNSAVDLNTVGSPMPVAIVGDDTNSFLETSRIDARNMTVKVNATPINDLTWIIGVVRATGDIAIKYSNKSNDSHKAIIQPMRGNLINITGVDHVVNISKYTDVFGDTEMERVFAEYVDVPSKLEFVIFYTLLGFNSVVFLVVLERTLMAK